MFAFARRKRSDFIGLDIDSKTIRLLQIGFNAGGWLIKKYASTTLPTGVIIDGKIQQAHLVQAALMDLVSKTQTAGGKTALALPSGAVITQAITMPPGLTHREYEMAIHTNLGRYFPGVTDTLCFDFLTQQHEIFLVAARQWQVESYAALVNAAGLRVKIVDVDRFALMRAVPFTVAEFSLSEVVALMHFGATYADLIIFSGPTILLQQRWQSAESLALLPAVKQALALYFSLQQKTIKSMVLSGTLPDETVALVDYFEQAADIKVYYADPLKLMQLTPAVDKQQLQKESLNLAICCGLAVRGFKSCWK